MFKLKYSKDKKEKKRTSLFSGLLAYAKLNKVVRRSFVAFAAVVIFATTYAMILPAITISVPKCGVEEHTHAESCYRNEKKLICKITDESHEHTDECYTEQKVLVCDKEVHVHSDECYEKNTEEATSEPAKTSALQTKEEPKNGSLGASTGGNTTWNEEELSQYTSIEEYLKTTGGKIESVLYDSNNNIIENIYEASGKGYTYSLELRSPYIMPGTYYYLLPKSMDVEFSSKTGNISNKGGAVIGEYRISEDSTYMFFIFDENAAEYQDIWGQIRLSVYFEETIDASVAKTGWLVSPEGELDGYFHFKISAKIPAHREGLAKREWKLTDRSEITYPWMYDFSDPLYASGATVSITFDGKEKRVIHDIKDVYNDSSENIAYYVDPNDRNKSFYLVNRCECTDSDLCIEEKNDKCYSSKLSEYPGWCTCWNQGDNATLEIEYKNAVNGANGEMILQDQNTISDNGTMVYENNVTLTGSCINSSGKLTELVIRKARADVQYGEMFDKTEKVKASGEGGYVSEFRITFNKEGADMSKFDADGDGKYDSVVVLEDSMENLKYLTGSMKITAEDDEGNLIELVAGTDFDVNTHQTEDGCNLEIKLFKLGKYLYYIDYETQVFADSSDKMVEIRNKAMLKSRTSSTYNYKRRFAYEEDWDFVKYEVDVLKVDYENAQKYLEGAVFALCTEDGEEIARHTTDKNGKALFATNANEGIVFKTDTLYYLEEKQAPEGYDINTHKYWFYFSNSKNPELESEMKAKYPGIDIKNVVPKKENSSEGDDGPDFIITNEKMFTLPETGGNGIIMYFSAGAFLIALSAVGIIILRHRFKGGYRG